GITEHLFLGRDAAKHLEPAILDQRTVSLVTRDLKQHALIGGLRERSLQRRRDRDELVDTNSAAKTVVAAAFATDGLRRNCFAIEQRRESPGQRRVFRGWRPSGEGFPAIDAELAHEPLRENCANRRRD